jgi:hypothetical protein
MQTPILRIGDGVLFIVKIRMRQKHWQCAWWWTGINIRRWRKLNILGFRLNLFDFMFLVLPL